MDKRIRKYILYKARTLGERQKELENLLSRREEMRQELLDTGGSIRLDGLPSGKGKVGNPTEQKALGLVEIDKRIEKLSEEIKVFKDFEKRVTGLQKEIYIETVKKDCTDLTAKAQLMHMGRRQLIEGRAKILRYIATELGEYLKMED